MKLFEYQGKELFQTYGIPVPKFQRITKDSRSLQVALPVVVKAQVLSSDRKAKGGILFANTAEEFEQAADKVFSTYINGETPEHLLIEEQVQFTQELYVSFSYDSDHRAPVLALSLKGGSGISDAMLFPVDTLLGVREFFVRESIIAAGIPFDAKLVGLIKNLWNMFSKEQALLAEINPLFKTEEGEYVAGDAKVILDDSIADPSFRPYLNLDGDIGILASGGGASLVNLDALLFYNGRPANYVEYSGNPPAEVVEELTIRVFSQPGLKGVWVVGGTANFTDIYETMTGFVQGLRKVQPKPTFPIVIRRDGPRQKEAFEMLQNVAKTEGYDFHVFGPEISMSESAKRIVELAYKENHS